MHKLKDLKVWKKSIELAKEVYLKLPAFPEEEKYNLISQIRRSAISASSNIAEGAGRNSNNEFKHFLGIANGSLYELHTQLILTKEIYQHIPIEEKLFKSIEEIQKMIYGLIKKLS